MDDCCDFDRVIDSRSSGAMRYELLESMFGRKDLTPMWIADMDFECCPAVAEAMRRRIANPVFGYSQAPESYWRSIISWLSRRHGVDVGREEITYANGVVKALAYAVNFFSSKGDRIIIQQPVYHPFRMVIEGNGREVSDNRLVRTDDGYRMDLDDLERRMADTRATMMVLCNPHNPAGVQWPEQTLAEVASMARRHGVVVVSDEIHGDLMLWGNRHVPFVDVSDDARQVGVWLGAPSKTFNIPGFMSSWMVVRNPKLREPFYAWLASNEFNDPCFTAVIAAEAAYTHGEEWLDRLIPYIEGNILAVERFVASELPGVEVVRPQASFLVWLDMRSLGMTQRQLVDTMVNDARLAMNDGTMFGGGGEGYMRLNVAAPRSVVMDSMERMRDALALRAGLRVGNPSMEMA